MASEDILEFCKFAVPAAGAIVAWFMNERRKALAAQMEKREQRYQELLRLIQGFYVGHADPGMRQQFIQQLKLCWLYAPDEVILKANAFLDSVSDQRPQPASDAVKETALAELVVAMRHDMLRRKLVSSTFLGSGDWKNHALPVARP